MVESAVQVLGVSYLHLDLGDEGELYLTTAGSPYLQQLLPSNWYEADWFRAHRQRLAGTAAVYHTATRPQAGPELELVVKFNRVGQDVAAGDADLADALLLEFNGPFEEFGLVQELRQQELRQQELRQQELRHEPRGAAVPRTQVPLAIYLPPERVQPWRSGRFEWRMARKLAQHPGVALDILRRYVLVYRWLPGIDAWEAQRRGLFAQKNAAELTERAGRELAALGYRVLDNKPQHVIIDPEAWAQTPPPSVQTVSYGLVDFELLERTHEHQRALERRRREAYDRQQRVLLGRDAPRPLTEAPAHLAALEVFGVPYIVGHTESTGGKLWVVGHEPDSYDLFLPERWRTTPHIRLWENHETFLTTTKDDLRLVWKVSRVGERPETAAFGKEGFRVLAHGINSPFEEVAMALWLLEHGIDAILPRAIYRTGHRSQLDDSLFDPSRFHSHQHLLTPDGEAVLQRRRGYITLWDGNSGRALGREEPRPVLRSVNCAEARQLGLLSSAEIAALLNDLRERMLAIGLEPLRLLPHHVVVLQDPEGGAVREDGVLVVHVCNFLYLRWVGQGRSSGAAEPASRR